MLSCLILCFSNTHLIRYSGLQVYSSYRWDHAVTLSAERRELKKEERGKRYYVTIYSIVLLQNYSAHEYYKQASMQVEPLPLFTVAVIRVLQYVQVAI